MKGFLDRLIANKWLHFVLLFLMLYGAFYILRYEDGVVRKIQNTSFDYFNKIYKRPPTDKVVVIDIDEGSLNAIGQWPWPRHVVGEIIRNLKELGVKSVGFDMVFAEEDRTSPRHFLYSLSDPSRREAVKTALEGLPDNEALLAADIIAAQNVTLGFTGARADETRNHPKLKQSFVVRKEVAYILDELKAKAHPISGAATPLPVLMDAAAGVGVFLSRASEDGVIRELPLVIGYRVDGKTELFPSLSLETLRVGGHRKDSVKLNLRKNDKDIKPHWTDMLMPPYVMQVGNSKLTIPFDETGIFIFHYRDIMPTEYVSAYKILDRAYWDSIRGRIKGRYAFVGSSAEGLRDLRSSPLRASIPGVEMHVNALEQMLQGRFLVRPIVVKNIEVIYLVSMGLLMILLAPFVNPFVLGGICLTIIASGMVGAFQAYVEYGLLIDPLYPSLAVVVLYFMSVMLSYLRASTERRAIRGAFGLYISPDFMKELTADPDKLKLGGEIRDLTVMFTDIRNFTTISESMTPEALINTMNDFLTPMSQEVMNARGTIDKYMGDAMMAFWNAPLDDPDHARHACDAALAMTAALAPVNAKLKADAEAAGRKFFPLAAGIGINSGPCAVGNMGSRQRFAYSALGDTVNLASRLEGQTKAYGITIMGGEETVNKVPSYGWMELDLIRVKGKIQPVRIFALIGNDVLAGTDEFAAWKGLHDRMLAAYRAQDFNGAKALIDQCRAADKGGVLGGFYDLYAGRIDDFLAHPPQKDWDGVYVATSK